MLTAEDKKIEDKKELTDNELKEASGGRLKINNKPTTPCPKCKKGLLYAGVCTNCGYSRN